MSEKYLGVHPIHLEKETVERLRRDELPVEVYPYKDGMFVIAPYNTKKQPPDLALLLMYAESKDCSIVWIDEGAEVHDSLQTYEWTWEDDNDEEV